MRRIQFGGFGTCLFSGGLFRFGLPPDAPQKKDEERIKVIESGWEPSIIPELFFQGAIALPESRETEKFLSSG
ncbi:hypothetical protein Abiwalacus_14570 [Akkermansia biwaensis]|jgi:hypothetical protein|uniref:Uncharacterized protein n=2 Tax=Akkermansia TaxID=239934 RepID=A0ABM7ZGN7_9BACT|nr:hypothetical protein Abiwalacus_14570 [Akkermansia biwaensis]